jgi:hypothetical protein
MRLLSETRSVLEYLPRFKGKVVRSIYADAGQQSGNDLTVFQERQFCGGEGPEIRW